MKKLQSICFVSLNILGVMVVCTVKEIIVIVIN